MGVFYFSFKRILPFNIKLYNLKRIRGISMIRKLIKEYIHLLNRQQVKTLNGQIKAGNEEGALKGLKKILKRQGVDIEYN